MSSTQILWFDLPDRRLRLWRRSLVAAWFGYTAVLGWLYIHLPPSPDHSVYDYIGWSITQGGVPYVDAADQNWPGNLPFHALSTALFGNHLESFRLFDYLFLLAAACGVLFVFVRRFVGEHAAWLAVPIYQAMYVSADRWVSGQRDVIAAPLLLAAGYALLRRRDGGRRRWCVLMGLCLAAAGLIRPTFFLLAPLLALWDLGWRRRGERPPLTVVADHALAGAALASLCGAVALAALPGGGLAAWYEVAVYYNFTGYVGESRTPLEIGRWLLHLATRSWHWYLALGLAGGVTAWHRGKREAVSALLLIALTTIASVFVQGKGLSYHAGPLLLVLAALIAGGVAHLSGPETLHGRQWRRWVAAAAVSIFALGLARKVTETLEPQLAWSLGATTRAEMLGGYDAGETEVGFTVQDAVATAAYLRAVVPADGTALVWGRPRLPNFLAERRLPIRFVGFDLMRLARPPSPLAEVWGDEVRRALAQHRPEVIVLFRAPDVDGYLYQEVGPDAPPPYRAVAEAVAAEYRLDRSFGSADCFRRRS